MDRNNIGPLLIALLGAFAVAIPVTIRSSGPAPPQVETPLTTPSGDRPLAAYEIIKYFFGFTDKEAYEAWTDQPDARKGYEIEFVIATLTQFRVQPRQRATFWTVSTSHGKSRKRGVRKASL